MWLSGTLIGFQFIKSPLKHLLSGALLCIAAGGFFLWYQSLYTGGNLGYAYIWEKATSPPRPNLAYGKRTTMRSALSSDHVHLRHSSKAVDGNEQAGSGFSTRIQENPVWRVDMNRPRHIGAHFFYESGMGRNVNKRPIRIYASKDREKWMKVASIHEEKGTSPLEVIFEIPLEAHYIDIHASGRCALQLDEVELFPPAGGTK